MKNAVNKEEAVNIKYRLLGILYQLIWDNHVTVSEMGREYKVSDKTIKRDIETIRSFFAESRDLVGNVELEYNMQKRCYKLNRLDGLSSQELLVVLKILVGSRTLDKDSLKEVIKRLTVCANNSGQEIFHDFCKNELDYYCPVKKKEDIDVSEFVWKLEKAIRKGCAVHIAYEKLNGEYVNRDLYPISVVFSDFYFYLLACRSDMEKSAIIYYRVDRMKEVQESKQRIPVSLMRRHQLDAARLCNQKMFMGEWVKIRFLYDGPSAQAILDRFPTAEIIHQDGTKSIMNWKAAVFSRTNT